MTRFSANLGFLWTDRALPDAIRAAHAAGFDAVECHWPYDIAADDVAAALAETGIPMLGLNTRRGDVAAGENGLAALPGRVDEARAAIDEALLSQPDVLEKIRDGKVQAAGAVIGAVMKAMGGQADAARVRELVVERAHSLG